MGCCLVHKAKHAGVAHRLGGAVGGVLCVSPYKMGGGKKTRLANDAAVVFTQLPNTIGVALTVSGSCVPQRGFYLWLGLFSGLFVWYRISVLSRRCRVYGSLLWKFLQKWGAAVVLGVRESAGSNCSERCKLWNPLCRTARCLTFGVACLPIWASVMHGVCDTSGTVCFSPIVRAED